MTPPIQLKKWLKIQPFFYASSEAKKDQKTLIKSA